MQSVVGRLSVPSDSLRADGSPLPHGATARSDPKERAQTAFDPATGVSLRFRRRVASDRLRRPQRHIGVDTVGLLLAVLVTAADVSDNVGGVHLLSQIVERHPRVTEAWADSGYRTKTIDHGATLGIDVEVTSRDPTQKGFTAFPRRWVVRRANLRPAHIPPRLAPDCKTHPHRSKAMIKVAVVDLMSRRLTHESTPNWRGS